MSHVTKIEEYVIDGSPRDWTSQRSTRTAPVLDEASLPVERPLTLYVWSCSCGDACGYYLLRERAELGALTHRMG